MRKWIGEGDNDLKCILTSGRGRKLKKNAVYKRISFQLEEGGPA